MRRISNLALTTLACSILGHNSFAGDPQDVPAIDPFVGEFSEDFETFVVGSLPESVRGQAGPFCALNDHATFSALGGAYRPLSISRGGVGLGLNGVAVPYDGEKGLLMAPSGDVVARFDFHTPIKDFGGYWVNGATDDRSDPITVTFFSAGDVAIAEKRVHYDGDLRGVPQWFGWTSGNLPITAIELQGFWVGLDGIQINTFGPPMDAPACHDFGSPVVINTDTTFDSALSFKDSGITVVDSPEGPTRAQLSEGGAIATNYRSVSRVRGASEFAITGGELGGAINVHDTGLLSISGGVFSYEPYVFSPIRVQPPPEDLALIVANDHATVVVSGGELLQFDASVVVTQDQSELTVSGGVLTGLVEPTVVTRGRSTLNVIESGQIISWEVAAIHSREMSMVNVLGGRVEGDNVFLAFDSSIVNLAGGTIDGEDGGLDLNDFSQFHISDGTLSTNEGASLEARDNSVTQISGGQVWSSEDMALHLANSARVHISGGHVQSRDGDGIVVNDQSIVDVWDGHVVSSRRTGLSVTHLGIANVWDGVVTGDKGGIYASRNGVVNLRGGEIAGLDDDEIDLVAIDSAVINIYGRGLNASPTAVTGTFADGSAFEFTFETSDNGKIILHELSDLTCDLDGDGSCLIDDLDHLINAIEANADLSTFDLNNDGGVDAVDGPEWLALAASENGFAEPYLVGDANLDGLVNAEDLNIVGVNWGQPGKTWSQGNFVSTAGNGGLGTVNSADLNALALNWDQSISRRTVAVPETSSFIAALCTLLTWAFVARRPQSSGECRRRLRNGN